MTWQAWSLLILQRTGLILPLLLVFKLAARLGMPISVSPAKRKLLLGTRIPTPEEWRARMAAVEQALSEQGSGGQGSGGRSILLTERNDPASQSRIERPLISVLVTTFGSERYLPNFLSNLAAQTALPQAEVIVVAVQPTEGERAMLQAASESMPMLRLIEAPERLGIYAAWNLALSESAAPFVTNMNVDDQRHPQSLEWQLAELQQTGADVVYQDVYLTLQHDIDWGLVERVGERTQLPLVGLSDLARGINAPHNAPMWRRELHQRVGLFDERYRSAGDHDFWIRVAIAGGRFHKSAAAHVAYFVNPDGMSTSLNSPGAIEGLTLLARYRRLV